MEKMTTSRGLISEATRSYRCDDKDLYPTEADLAEMSWKDAEPEAVEFEWVRCGFDENGEAIYAIQRGRGSKVRTRVI